MSDKKPRGRVGSTGNKMRMTLGLPTYAMLNCADNTGAKEMMVIAVKCVQGRQNRLPAASIAEMCVASCKKGKPDYRKKGVFFFHVFLRTSVLLTIYNSLFSSFTTFHFLILFFILIIFSHLLYVFIYTFIFVGHSCPFMHLIHFSYAYCYCSSMPSMAQT